MDLKWCSFVFLLFIFVLFLHQWLFASTSHNKKKLPPSPPKLPIIGHLHQLGSLPHRSLQKLAKQYGPLMLLHFGSRPVLIASSVDAARNILKTHDLVFSNRPKSSICDRVLYGSKDVAFCPFGEYWKQVRSISVLHLLSNKMVRSFRDVREEETSKMIQKIEQAGNSLIDLRDMFSSLTNNVISRVASGRRYDEGDTKIVLARLAELLGTVNIGDYIPWLSWVNKINGLDRKIEEVAQELDNFMEDVLEEHMTRNKGELRVGEAKDLVDVLLEIQKRNVTDFPLQRDSVKALIVDMFGAGTETTYTTLEWTMTELLRHPKAMEKLQNDVRGVGNGKPEITEDDLGNLHYLTAVIKESLRLHPPAPLLVPRESNQDVRLNGYHIEAGTQVIVNAWAIGRDPLLWENPDEFRPERFLDSAIDFKGSHFELIPFGAGRRGCPGSSFAIAVNEIAIARLVHKFRLALPGEIKGEDLDMTEAPAGLTVHRKSPLLALATPCSSYHTT